MRPAPTIVTFLIEFETKEVEKLRDNIPDNAMAGMTDGKFLLSWEQKIIIDQLLWCQIGREIFKMAQTEIITLTKENK